MLNRVARLLQAALIGLLAWNADGYEKLSNRNQIVASVTFKQAGFKDSTAWNPVSMNRLMTLLSESSIAKMVLEPLISSFLMKLDQEKEAILEDINQLCIQLQDHLDHHLPVPFISVTMLKDYLLSQAFNYELDKKDKQQGTNGTNVKLSSGHPKRLRYIFAIWDYPPNKLSMDIDDDTSSAYRDSHRNPQKKCKKSKRSKRTKLSRSN